MNFLVLALTTGTVAAGSLKLANSDPGARLPKTMSDMSAVVGPDNLIYIAGGCDSPFGSQLNEEEGTFRCNSVSNSFYAFDPETQKFTELLDMPEGRYRHAAVAVNNQIWLVGGRDQYDNIVGNVHVSEKVLVFERRQAAVRGMNIMLTTSFPIASQVYDLEDKRWRVSLCH